MKVKCTLWIKYKYGSRYLYRDLEMPIQPVPGMYIEFEDDDESYKVESVYFAEPDELGVFFYDTNIYDDKIGYGVDQLVGEYIESGWVDG